MAKGSASKRAPAAKRAPAKKPAAKPKPADAKKAPPKKPPAQPRGRTPSVVLAVRRDLKELEARSPGISQSALAATALAMARELDDRENSASGMAACALRLTTVMGDLRLKVLEKRADSPPPPESEKGDGVDSLAARRAARRSAS